MSSIALYAHGGSGNHGCEAIVRGLVVKYGLTHEDCLLSNRMEEDERYGLDRLLSLKSAPSPVKTNMVYRILAHLSGNVDRYYYRQRYRKLGKLSSGFGVAFSIGGDNYCYPGMAQEMAVMRQILANTGIRTVLMGCSVDTSLLPHDVLVDMNGYDEIICRESLTLSSLQSLGFKNLSIQPDTAFFLARKDKPLPGGFLIGNTVGINISPHIIDCGKERSIVLRNYVSLIAYILKNTDMSIALIPHVVWDSNDDRLPLRCLFDAFSHTGRIMMIEDDNADVLKGYIARCRFMVAARTHASIAAYGSGVPTLVLGYSIKSRGLAKDMFGDEEHHVLPVRELGTEDDLTNAFRWFLRHEDSERNHYTQVLPDYLAGGRF